LYLTPRVAADTLPSGMTGKALGRVRRGQPASICQSILPTRKGVPRLVYRYGGLPLTMPIRACVLTENLSSTSRRERARGILLPASAIATRVRSRMYTLLFYHKHRKPERRGAASSGRFKSRWCFVSVGARVVVMGGVGLYGRPHRPHCASSMTRLGGIYREAGDHKGPPRAAPPPSPLRGNHARKGLLNRPAASSASSSRQSPPRVHYGMPIQKER